MPDDARTRIPAEAAKHLQEKWIPRLRDLKKEREFTCRVMQIVLIACLVFAFGLALLMVRETLNAGGLNLALAWLLLIFLGVPALCFVWLGKLQSCNDVLVLIEGFIYLQDRRGLVASFEKIECLGAMKGILDDAKRLIKHAA